MLADGPHLVVKVNGETLTDARDEKLREGAIGLQAGGPTGSGPIKFANVDSAATADQIEGTVTDVSPPRRYDATWSLP